MACAENGLSSTMSHFKIVFRRSPLTWCSPGVAVLDYVMPVIESEPFVIARTGLLRNARVVQRNKSFCASASLNAFVTDDRGTHKTGILTCSLAVRGTFHSHLTLRALFAPFNVVGRVLGFNHDRVCLLDRLIRAAEECSRYSFCGSTG